MAAVSIEIDRRSLNDFQRALQTYRRATGKDIPQVVNRAAINLAFRAAQFTKKADVESIKQLTGVRNPYALVNWNARQKGRKPPKRSQMEAAVQRLINARVAAAGFIRRGWVTAAKKLRERSGVRVNVKVEGVGRRKGKGTATAAREALVSFAEIVNFSTSKSTSSGDALEQYGGDGLRASIRFVADDMRTYAEKKLAQRAKEFNR